MPTEENGKKRHIILNTPASKEGYTSPKTGRPASFILATRDRERHGQHLINQLNTVRQQEISIRDNRAAVGIRGDYGIYIEFESEPTYELSYESLEDQLAGIEVENIREENEKNIVTVYVPEGKLVRFFKKVESYLTKDTKKGNPRNQKLIENISAIRLATLKSFWTDFDNYDYISETEERWWEIWLRAGDDSNERDTIDRTFLEVAQSNHIEVSNQRLHFPERTVFLVKASKAQLSGSVLLLNCLAELRSPKDTSDFFMRLPLNEQRQWVDELLTRTSFAPDDSPAVCLLDSGVNNGRENRI